MRFATDTRGYTRGYAQTILISYTRGYLFAVLFFDFYAYRGRVNKGNLGGLAKVLKIRDRHHIILSPTLSRSIAYPMRDV